MSLAGLKGLKSPPLELKFYSSYFIMQWSFTVFPISRQTLCWNYFQFNGFHTSGNKMKLLTEWEAFYFGKFLKWVLGLYLKNSRDFGILLE